jgi:hypothetical protein
LQGKVKCLPSCVGMGVMGCDRQPGQPWRRIRSTDGMCRWRSLRIRLCFPRACVVVGLARRITAEESRQHIQSFESRLMTDVRNPPGHLVRHDPPSNRSSHVGAMDPVESQGPWGWPSGRVWWAGACHCFDTSNAVRFRKTTSDVSGTSILVNQLGGGRVVRGAIARCSRVWADSKHWTCRRVVPGATCRG